MRIAAVALLVWCNTQQTATPPPPDDDPPPAPRAHTRAPCPEEVVLLREDRKCGDIRGGWSGFHLLEVASGPHQGDQVIVSYGEAQPNPTVGAWNIAKVTFQPIDATGRRWPNQCTQIRIAGSTTAPYAGFVDTFGAKETIAAYPDEAAARDAFAERCPL